MSDKLILNHTVLLAKGWYKHSKYLWQDYKRAIYCDGHFCPETRNEVAQVLYAFIMGHKALLKGFVHDESDIPQKIRDYMDRVMWRNKQKGIEESPLDLYDDAVILFCHGVLQVAEIKLFDKILAPSQKVLPLNIWENETIEERDKRFAEQFKGKLPYDDEDPYSKRYIDDYHPLAQCIAKRELIYEIRKEYTLMERMPKEGECILKGDETKPFYVTRTWINGVDCFTDELKKRYNYFIYEEE